MCDPYPKAPSHNAFASFNDVSGAACCTAHERSSADRAGGLSSDTVGRYNVITPNLRA
jgi:hypothetical protein